MIKTINKNFKVPQNLKSGATKRHGAVLNNYIDWDCGPRWGRTGGSEHRDFKDYAISQWQRINFLEPLITLKIISNLFVLVNYKFSFHLSFFRFHLCCSCPILLPPRNRKHTCMCVFHDNVLHLDLFIRFVTAQFWIYH